MIRHLFGTATIVALILMTPFTASAASTLVEKYDVPYQSKWEPAKAAPKVAACRIPIISERTGEVLYWNWSRSDCYEIQEDGTAVVVSTGTDHVIDDCEVYVPETPKEKKQREKKERQKGKKERQQEKKERRERENNGHGDGDQSAPGNSLENNNAENSGNSGQGNSGNGQGGHEGEPNIN